MVRTSRSAWRVAATHSVAAALVAALSAVGASVANAQPAAKTATPTAAASPSQRAPARVTNSLGMHFVRIPAGEFTMGSGESMARLTRAFPGFEPDELQPLVDEAPAHRVRITRSYYLGQHEVTVGQFRRFLQASGYVPESIADGTGGYGYNAAYDPRTSASGDNFDGRDPRYAWANPGFAQGDDHPVVNVTWNDAVAMARWLSRSEGRRYRLPTEAEWEYAARAGTTTRFHCGDQPVCLLRVANTLDLDALVQWPALRETALAQSDGHAFTAPVGHYAPNAWGLHDMHGNAWEWVADRYSDTTYRSGLRIDPKGPMTGDMRVRRGGSWRTTALYARVTYRNWNTPQTRYPLVGMRLLLEAQTAQPIKP